MYDPVIISYGKGQLPAYLADPDLHTDIVSTNHDIRANMSIIEFSRIEKILQVCYECMNLGSSRLCGEHDDCSYCEAWNPEKG